MYLFFSKFFSHFGYYRVLSRVAHLSSRSMLVICFKYSSVYISIPNSKSILPLHPFPLVTIHAFSKSVNLLPLYK